MNANIAHAITALNTDYIRKHSEEALQSIKQLSSKDMVSLINSQSFNDSLNIWENIRPDQAADLVPFLDEDFVLRCLQYGDPVHAARIMVRLTNESREHFLVLLDSAKQQELRRLIVYPEDSAGALMDVRFIPFSKDDSVREALYQLRKKKPRFKRELYVLDDDGHLISMLELQQLALAESTEKLGALAKPVKTAIMDTESREQVVLKFETYKVTDLPVVDFNHRLVGVIRYDALVNASLEQNSADLLTMVGASKDERALSKVSFVVRKRLPWLEINLLTAFLAAAVVGLFEGTIAKFTALAVLLPVVAGQSGNTGAQALAVTMRGLALREIGTSHWLRVARKELGAGFINGIAIALTTSAGVWWWSGSPGLAFVINVSMIISMAMAGVAGVIIPITLSRIGQDPAQSSSIILTTVTDVVGFFTFLGIATLLASFL